MPRNSFIPNLFLCLFLIIFQAAIETPAFGEEGISAGESPLRTSYTEIFYPDESVLRQFLWRVTGKRFILPNESDKAGSRVDDIVVRVMEVLDMRPPAFRVRIRLEPEYSSGNIASYSHSDRTILIYADKVTDGVFAHELSHAVISAYFLNPPPEKMQEIMCQYVDKHLWEDY